MSKRLLVATLWASLTATGLAPVAANANCQRRAIAELPVDLQSGLPRIGVVINGQRGWLNFLSNSGVSILLLKSAAETLSIKPEATDFFTNREGKQAPIYGGVVRAFQLDGDSLRTVEAFITDRDASPTTEVWGQISPSFFTWREIEYDLANRKITVFDTQYCSADDPFYKAQAARSVKSYRDDPMVFSGVVAGRTLAVELRSGHKVSTINTAGVRLANLKVSASARKKTDDSWLTDEVATLEGLKIGAEATGPVQLRIPPESKFPSIPGYAMGYAGTPTGVGPGDPTIELGVDFFLTHRVLVSPAQRRIYIMPADEAKSPPSGQGAAAH